MTSPRDRQREAAFKRPEGAALIILGGLIGAATLGGAGLAAAMIRDIDLAGRVMVGLGLIGGLALATGFLNAGRQPMLIVEPGCLTIPSFFGKRAISVSAGQKVGELLATPVHGGSRAGGVDENRFVHFFVPDASGKPVLLVAVHRAAPMVAEIRRALKEIAGLRVEIVSRDPKAGRPVPDMTEWWRD